MQGFPGPFGAFMADQRMYTDPRYAANKCVLEPGETHDPSSGMLGTFGFGYGQTVLIHGLSDLELNGQRAVVLPKAHSDKAREAWEKGRVPVCYRPGGGVATIQIFVGVQALPGDRVLSIKPSNLGTFGLKNVPGMPFKLGEELYWECAKGTSMQADDAPVPAYVSELIKRGADVSWEHPTNGATVLNNACNGYSIEVIKLLLAAGADPDEPADGGGSIFHCLAAHHQDAQTKIKIMKLLLEHGASAKSFNTTMQTSAVTCLEMARQMSTKSRRTAAQKSEMLECVALMEAAM